MEQYRFNSIGIIRSCFKEKFGIPRQPALVASPATIEIESCYSEDEAFRELEDFSHIWVVFVFHDVIKKSTPNSDWHPTIRPPRLGGNKRIGVFASRSMFRPNPIGLSVVELNSIERKNKKIILNITGGDFLDTTPVLDIKPYIPYTDSIGGTKSGYANAAPERKMDVEISYEAHQDIENHCHQYPQLEKLIIEIVALDPRPAYQKEKNIKSDFSMKLYTFDLKWKVEGNIAIVTSLKDLG